ncbi:MAG: DUF748 domain-containing protein [Desulfobulbaceae bacterium]|nr:DUF748 domain-containing protein [Desulfobulbaceae bacterium]
MIIGRLLTKRWMKVLLGLVAVVTLLLVLLPVGVKYYLTDWLRKNGADQARIESLRLNPFLGRITMEGMDVQTDGQSLLRNARMVLDLDLLSLLQRDVHVERAEYRDLSIDIEQRADGSWRFGSYSMTGGAETESEAADNDAASSWAVLADQVALTDCRVRLKTPQMDLVLAVAQAELLRFSTREGRPSASFMLTGLLNDAPLAIDLDRVELVPELQIDGAITISGFHLETIAGLLRDTLPTFAGGISLAGDVSFGQTTETGMQAVYDGTFAADTAAVGSDGFSTTARSLSWQGRVDYSGTDDDGLTVLVDGELAGADYGLRVPDAALDMTLSRIELGGRIELTVADQGRITAHHREGAVRVEGFGLHLPQLDLSEERLVWQGDIRYDTDPQGRGMSVQTDGGLELGALHGAVGDDSSRLQGEVNSFFWQGAASYGDQRAGESQIELDGELSLAGLLVADGNAPGQADAVLDVSLELVELAGRTEVTIGDRGRTTVHHDQGGLEARGIDLQFPRVELSEDRLVWQGEVLYDSDHQGRGLLVQADGGLELGVLDSAFGDGSSGLRGGAKSLAWQGTASYADQGAEESRIGLDGLLSVAEVLAEFDESGLRIAQQNAELRAVSTVTLGDGVGVDGHHELTLEQFDLGRQDQTLVAFDRVRIDDLEGRGELKLALKDMQVSNLQAAVPGSLPLQVAITRVGLSELTSDDLAGFQVGEMSLEQAVVTATRNGEQLARVAGIQIQDVAGTDRPSITVGATTVDQLVLLPAAAGASEQPAMTLGMATLDGLRWSETAGVEGNTLHLADLAAAFVREPSGKFVLARRLGAMQEPDTASTAGQPMDDKQENETNQTAFSLNKVLIDGTSVVSFTDYTLPTPFAANLTIDLFEAGRLDTGSPDRETTVLLQGELEGRAPVELSGTIAPFLHYPAADLRLNLKNYPLRSLSPYTVQAVGTALASGQLRLESELDLADDQLQLDNAVLLQQLQTETITPSLAEELDNQLPVPLDAALSLLRDDDGNIELNVPLSGPVSDLGVGISGVLITALGQAIVPAASGYMMYALGPYGALAYVGMKLGEKMLEVVLPPVVFAAQETAITAEHIDYLERVGTILSERPETDMQLCPTAASWEFLTPKQREEMAGTDIEVDAEDREQLAELGQRRAAAVRDYLVENTGIKRDRLLICETRITAEQDAQPAVLLQM